MINNKKQYIWFNHKYANIVKNKTGIDIQFEDQLVECFIPAIQQQMNDSLSRALNGESFSVIIKPSKKQKGTNSCFEWNFSSLKEDGNIVAVVCYINDFTEHIEEERIRYRNLKALFESRLSGFTQIIPDMVTISNIDGTRKFVNKSYCEFFGVKDEEVIGKSYFPSIPKEEKKTYAESLGKISMDSPTISHVHLLKNAKGKEQWILWNETALFDKEGRAIELLSIGRNVDDIVRAKQVREQYIGVLEKTIFKASHEVRQPVSNILGLAQILEKENYNPAELEFIVRYFKESAAKLDLFTKELTAFIHNSIKNNPVSS